MKTLNIECVKDQLQYSLVFFSLFFYACVSDLCFQSALSLYCCFFHSFSLSLLRLFSNSTNDNRVYSWFCLKSLMKSKTTSLSCLMTFFKKQEYNNFRCCQEMFTFCFLSFRVDVFTTRWFKSLCFITFHWHLQFIWKKMNVTQFYAIVASDCIILLFVIHFLIRLNQFIKLCDILLWKHLVYFLLLRQHRLLRSWTHAQMIFQLIYLEDNVFCTCFKISTASEATTCARNLLLINMMSMYFEFHLSFICNLLDVSLLLYHFFHASIEIMFILLDLLHVIIHMTDKSSSSMSDFESLFKLIVDHCAFQKFNFC